MTYTCTLNSGVFQWYFSVSVVADVSRNSLSSHVSDGRTRSVRQSHASAFPCVRQTLRQTRSQSWDSFLRHYIYSGVIPRTLREQSISNNNVTREFPCGNRMRQTQNSNTAGSSNASAFGRGQPNTVMLTAQ